MPDRYPGYDVLAKRQGPSWDEQTRQTVAERLSIPLEPRFLSQKEWVTLQAVCARILPQPSDRTPIPLAAYVDEKLWHDRRDGYRLVDLPPLREAWRQGLAALNAEAEATLRQAFHQLQASEQDDLLKAMQAGRLQGPAWAALPCHLFFSQRLLPDITRAYYAHPTSWSEIGFGGPASPRGYVRMDLGRRDPWEASQARLGRQIQAQAENDRVGRR